MTDAAKAKVWDAYVEPFGQATMFGAPSAGLPIRLPGQWEELENGDLFQNWHRNYDPSLGRYVQVDPLGIDAGQNPYSYVDGDPLNAVDPMGLIVRVTTTDKKAARILMNAYARLTTTKRGREIAAALEADCIVYEIRPIQEDAFYCPPGSGGKCRGFPHTVFIDPYRRLMLLTTKGMQPAPLAVVLGHELGHATGTKDDGPNKMNNVSANENPVRRSLGISERTQYVVPTVIWVPVK